MSAQPPSRLVPRPGEPKDNIVRLGVQTRPLSDMYHFFLQARWRVVCAVFIIGYLTINAVFAGLYGLDDHAIANTRPGSYLDAFFFSVQTLATIGYGTMAPNSLYAHILVTIEALTGVLCVALATGLIFAKFSRPSARVLFSRVAVVTTREGAPCLLFRMANERTSHIVEAQLKVFLSRDEITAEGDTMRRFHDLLLVRHHSPLFPLTWTAIHMLDAHSPLRNVTSDILRNTQAEVVVSFVGLDETTLQSVHARHSYIADEILFGRRFVDVLSRQANGQRLINYQRFHDVLP